MKKHTKTFLLTLSALTIGIGISALSNFGVIKAQDKAEYSGFVVETKENYFIFLSGVERFYVVEQSHEREIGDYLVIQDSPKEVKFTTYESQFDFKEYLSSKGVSRSLSSKHIQSKFNNPIKLNRVKRRFLSRFDEDTKALVNAFLFNQKDYQNKTIQNLSDMNLLILISLSGLHISFLTKILKYLLELKFDEKISSIICVLFITPLAIFAFPKVGVMRVYLSLILTLINKYLLKSKFSSLTVLSFLAAIFILLDFHVVYSEAFIIGFGLSFVFKLLNTSLMHKKKWVKRVVYPFMIYLFILPFTTFGSGELHLFTFIYQILLVPFSQICFVVMLLNFYGIPIFTVTTYSLKGISSLSQILFQINPKIPFGDFEPVYTVVYFVLYFYALWLIESLRKRHLRYLSIGFVGFLSLGSIPTITLLRNAIYFINVGQGDSILIQNHNNVVMIDTGGNTKFDMAEETLIPFLHKKQIYHIDYLITTHDDFDHSGAAKSLCEKYKVKNYIKDRHSFPISIGKLSLDNLNYFDGKEENDESLVLTLNFMNKKWLFTGDASIDVEKWMIVNKKDLDCDILKVGHHGSKTSTCDEFLKIATPDEAIISCGINNIYHHPNKEVIDRLNKYNIKIRRTDLEGTISYVSYFS